MSGKRLDAATGRLEQLADLLKRPRPADIISTLASAALPTGGPALHGTTVVTAAQTAPAEDVTEHKGNLTKIITEETNSSHNSRNNNTNVISIWRDNDPRTICDSVNCEELHWYDYFGDSKKYTLNADTTAVDLSFQGHGQSVFSAMPWNASGYSTNGDFNGYGLWPCTNGHYQWNSTLEPLTKLGAYSSIQGCMHCLNSVPRGDDAYNHNGRSIRLDSLDFKCQITPIGSINGLTATGSKAQTLRLLVVYDNNNNGAQTKLEDVLYWTKGTGYGTNLAISWKENFHNSPCVISPYNDNFVNRFKILIDETWNMSGNFVQTVTNPITIGSVGEYQYINYRKKINLKGLKTHFLKQPDANASLIDAPELINQGQRTIYYTDGDCRFISSGSITAFFLSSIPTTVNFGNAGATYPVDPNDNLTSWTPGTNDNFYVTTIQHAYKAVWNSRLYFYNQ